MRFSLALVLAASTAWADVRVNVPRGAVIKVDGKVMPASDVVVLSAGPHQVDVLFADGRALLQKVDFADGSRVTLETKAPFTAGESTSRSGVRIGSYATWMVGAVTLLSAFLVGFVGRQTADGQSPCTVSSRECVTYAMATEQARRAGTYASTANVLLGIGLLISLGGAGLFTFDVLR